MGLQERQFFRGLHPLGNDAEPEASAQADHRADRIVFAGDNGHLANERLIDLEGVDRKFLEIAQT